MSRRLSLWILALIAVALAAFWWLTAPNTLAADDLPQHEADLANGEILFHAGGCASCHAAPGAKGDARKTLSGGVELKTPFGTFRAPNISPHPDAGIGGWSTLDFINAMARGVSPNGSHYYPSFPYASYQRMPVTDLIDLKAYLDTLPQAANPSPGHDLPLPFRLRRGLGLWKLLYLDGQEFRPAPHQSAEHNRGAYLVNGPGHCGECHTPRTLLGGMDHTRWLAGGPSPEGKGKIPNITAHEDGIAAWTKKDIVYALETGFTPEFDSLGSTMAAVQENMAALPATDREAIATYLKAVPPRPSKPR